MSQNSDDQAPVIWGFAEITFDMFNRLVNISDL
jgi:hypothetical protein